MLQLTTLTGDANQQVSVLLSDQSLVTLILTFRPQIQRWTFDVIYTSTQFEADGLMLCNHANILRSFRNTIPFGLVCVSSDGTDPFTQNDFVSGRVTLYILDNTGSNTDVEYVEENLLGGLF